MDRVSVALILEIYHESLLKLNRRNVFNKECPRPKVNV